MTETLLALTHETLIDFTASEGMFDAECCAALARCGQLRSLDLADAAVPFDGLYARDLMQAVTQLTRLKTLHLLPGVSADSWDTSLIQFPGQIVSLELPGLDFEVAQYLAREGMVYPTTLKSLVIGESSELMDNGVRILLDRMGPGLTSLEVHFLHRLHGSKPGHLNFVLSLCPNLKQLSTPGDLITNKFLHPSPHSNLTRPHPLEILSFTATESIFAWKQVLVRGGREGWELDDISPVIYFDNLNILQAMQSGFLANLRQVNVDNELLWMLDCDEEEVDMLRKFMQDAAAADQRAGGDGPGNCEDALPLHRCGDGSVVPVGVFFREGGVREIVALTN